ncbi:MAG: S9 family peptidase [Asticcacaulis sp.]|uniref:alpha/beta hydrolase family protein n=1 Tax=Asticcacaulis sp. TaxID=1872648 RepID=UPI0039E47FEA
MTANLNRRHLLATAGAGVFSAILASKGFAQNTQLPPVPPPEQWAKSPSLDFVSLSPDGNHIAYIKEDAGTKFLYEYNIIDNKFQTFNLGKAKIAGLFWIDAIHLVVSTLATAKEDAFSGGRSTFQIVSIYNLQTQTITIPFSQIDGFKSFVTGGLHVITQDGRKQLTAASYPVNFDESQCLYSFDLDKELKFNLLDRAPWGTRKWVLTPQGDMLARSVFYNKSSTWVLQYRKNNAWKDIYTVKSDLDFPSLIGLARDGTSLIVYKPGGGDEDGRYYEVSPEGVFSSPLPIEGPDAGPVFDPKTFRMCGYRNYDGWSHYHYDDPLMQDLVKKAQVAMDGYRMSIADYADDPRKMIIYSEGDDDSGTYYFIDFATGKTITIGLAYPDIPVEWISAKKAIKYKASDGLEIEAYLTLPPNREAKNLPLVVIPHGGPVARDGLGYDPEAQAYASRGYAVLQPNYRGSDGYGDAFIVAGYGQWGKKMQTDLSDGVRYLTGQGMADPKRVCIVGASYGGYAALAGVTLDPGVYNCAVDVAGLSNLRTFLEWSRDYDSGQKSTSYNVWKRRFGDDSNLDSASPIKNIGNVTVPILIVHGKDDTVVPFDQSTTMVSALKAAGKDVTFVQYDHTDHWETNEAARVDMYKTIVAFIEKHNPPV